MPAGTTPQNFGGVNSTAWVDRTDLTLRSDINIVQKRFACVADMVSDTSLIVGQIVETIGYYDGWAATASKPKGGNRYEIVAASTGATDGGSFIALSNGLQAKGLFIDGNSVNLYQFGFSNSSDNLVEIQNTIDFASTNSLAVDMPTSESINITLVSGVGLQIPDYCTINGNNSTITITNTDLQTYKIISFNNFAKHIRINDLYVVGDVLTNTQTSGEWGMGFQFASNDDVVLKNCGAKYCWGDGIYLGVVSGYAETNGTIILDNFNADDNRRQGLSIISCRNLVVIGGNYDNTGKTSYTAPGCGIDIEPNAKDVCDVNAKFIGVNTKGNKRQGFLVSLQNAGDPDYLIDGKDFVEINLHFIGCTSLGDGGVNDYTPAIRVVGVGDAGTVPAYDMKGSIVFDNTTATEPEHIGIECVNLGYIPDVVFNGLKMTDIMCAKSEGETLGTSSLVQITQRGGALTMSDYKYSKLVINGINYKDTRGNTFNASNNATDGYHRVKRPVWFYNGLTATTPFPSDLVTFNDFTTNIEPAGGFFSNIGNVFKFSGRRPKFTQSGSISTYSGYMVGVEIVCEDTGSLQTVYLPDSATYPQYIGQTLHYYSDNAVGYLRFIAHGSDVLVNRDGTLVSSSPYIYQKAYPQGDYWFKCVAAGVWSVV